MPLQIMVFCICSKSKIKLTQPRNQVRESLLPRAGGHHKSPDQRDVDVCFRKCCEAWTWHQSFIGVVKSKHSFGRVPARLEA